MSNIDYNQLLKEKEELKARLAETEKVLREKELQFSAAFHVSPAAQIITEMKTGRIIEVNEAFCRMTESERGRLIGRTTLELDLWVNPDDREKVLRQLDSGGYVKDMEVMCRTRSGKLRALLTSFEIIDLKGVLCMISSAVDITERRQAEEATKKSNARIEEAQILAHIGNWEWDIENQTLLWSDEIYRIFGLKQGEFIPSAEAFESLIHPEDREDFLRQRKVMLDEKKYACIDHRIVLPDGEIRHVQERARLILNEHGKVAKVIGTVQDITERRQAEEKLRLAKEKLDKIAAAVPGVICSFHQSLTGQASMPYASPVIKDVYGLDPQDIADDMTPIFSRILPEDTEHVIATIAHSAQTMTIWKDEFRYLHPTKGLVWIEGHSMPVREADGSLTWHGFVADITERRQAKEKLQRSEMLLKEMGRIAEVGGWELDVATMKQVWTDETYAIHDREKSEYTPSNSEEIGRFESGSKELIEKSFRNAITKGIPYDLEAEMTTVKGNRKWVRAVCFPVIDNGKVIRLTGTLQDITERKLANEKLRESEERLRLVLETTSDGFWIVDSSRKFRDVNQAYLDMSGYTREEFLSMTISDMEAIESARDTDARIQRILQEGSARFETRHRRKDGSIFDAEVSVNLLTREPVLMICFCRDITQRKLEEKSTETRLRLAQLSHQKLEINALIRSMLDEAEMLTGSQTGFFYFIDAGRNAISMPVWSANTLKQCSTDKDRLHFPVAQAGVWADSIRKAAPVIYNDYLSLPERKKLPEGHPPITRLLSVAVKRNNKVVATFGVGNKLRDYDERDIDMLNRLADEAFDIILHRQAEQKLHASEEKYRGLLESLDNPVFTVDAKGRFLYMNDIAAREVGGRPDEMIGRHIHELFPQEYADRQTDNVLRTIREAKPIILEEQCFFSGKLRWIRASHQPIHDESGAVAYVLVNITDIDDLKVTQQKLEELNRTLEQRVEQRTDELNLINKELAHASRAKDEFLANMSHELRTPLTGILGMSESLQEEVIGPLNERQQKYMKNIEYSGQHLLQLINDILDLSKIEAGKLEPQFEMVSVSEISQVSLSFVKQPANKKRIKLQFVSEPASFRMIADPRRLKQIIINLLNNAVKFTSEGGNVSLNVRADSQEKVVCFTVEDSGIGISAQDIARLFTPFTQVDSSLSRQHEGTGLGLVMVRKLAEMHGGGVTVESGVGKGSRFTVTLPWRQDTDSAVSVSPIQPDDSPKAQEVGRNPRNRILLAEDNPVNVRTTQDYLTHIGYEVIVARHGGEVIAMAEKFRPDLILMDVQMPVTDGLEVTGRLRNISEFRNIPIIALTALAMPGDRERCIGAGADEYLAKPFRLGVLRDMIGKLLNRK